MTEYRAKLKNAGDQLGGNPKIGKARSRKSLQSGNDTIGLLLGPSGSG